jgi:hypothetical protein
LGGQATVGRQRLTDDKGRIVGGKKQDGARNLFRPAILPIGWRDRMNCSTFGS